MKNRYRIVKCREHPHNFIVQTKLWSWPFYWSRVAPDFPSLEKAREYAKHDIILKTQEEANRKAAKKFIEYIE